MLWTLQRGSCWDTGRGLAEIIALGRAPEKPSYSDPASVLCNLIAILSSRFDVFDTHVEHLLGFRLVVGAESCFTACSEDTQSSTSSVRALQPRLSALRRAIGSLESHLGHMHGQLRALALQQEVGRHGLLHRQRTAARAHARCGGPAALLLLNRLSWFTVVEPPWSCQVGGQAYGGTLV